MTSSQRATVAGLTLVLSIAGLTGCAGEVTTGPPPLTSIKQNHSESTEQMIECLSDAGWEVEHDAVTGTVDIELPEDQFAIYSEARAFCIEEVEKQFPIEPLTDEQMDEIYAYEVWLAECLRSEDVDVPEIPSAQTYIDAYRSGDPWLSYNFVGAVDEATYRSLMESCPQL